MGRIGVLTGGGDRPCPHAGIPGGVRKGGNAPRHEIMGFRYGWARRLAQEGVPVVGVPKTIDNDLAATDYTFGFQTAVQIATDAIDRLHTTAESHDRVMILEVMGRNAGWIALYAGLAGGADIILIPEIA